MRKTCLVSSIVVVFLGQAVVSRGAEPHAQVLQTPQASERFAREIEAFEKTDKKSPPPKGAIVCIGSSSMRLWHESICTDLAPLTVIPRGFGGSTMNDALNYVDRIVLPHQPRAVLLYEGDNDIAAGTAPEKILEAFKAFVLKVHARLPRTRIYSISIKPSIKRWHLWPQMQKANSLLAAECEHDDLLTFIDVATPMLDASGQPRADIFKADNLHMNAQGYAIWRNTVRPVLVKNELKYEAKRD